MKEKVSEVRGRYSRKEREEIIGEYERSGVTQRELVEKYGISVATLSNWLRAHRQNRQKQVEFKPVDMSGVFNGRAWAAEVLMPDGVVVRLGTQADAALVQRLVKV